MTEQEPVDWVKTAAERRAHLPVMRGSMLIAARDTLNRIVRMPANTDGSPFVSALSFNREELMEIQSVLRNWIQRDDVSLMEELHGR